MKISILTALVVCASGLAGAATIHVPADYAAIQEAIVAAAAGDTVLVAPGTYVENLDFLGKAITVKSSDGAAATVIDGGSPAIPDFGSVAAFASGEGLDSVLEGFTLQNGTGTKHSWGQCGGAVFCLDSKPIIRNNVIQSNEAPYGAGVFVQSAAHLAPLIESNVIENNAGVGLWTYYSDPAILDNTIRGNKGPGIRCQEYSRPLISSNIIADNTTGIFMDNSLGEISENFIYANHQDSIYYAGGIYCFDSHAAIHSNIIIQNATIGRGGGIYCCHSSTDDIRFNLIWGNTASEGGGIAAFNDSNPIISFNTIVKNSATSAGGGAYIEANSSWPPQTLWLSDDILWDNDAPLGPELKTQSADAAIDYCDLEGGLASIDVDGGWFAFGDHMIDADPLFADPAAGDFRLRQDPCQPGVMNPCVDAGSTYAMNLNMFFCSTRTDDGPDEGKVDLGMHIGTWPEAAWQVDTVEISAATGGSAVFTLEPESGSNREYIILGSATGISPGIPLPGGLVELPLTWDPFTDLVLMFLNTPVFQNFYGIYSFNSRTATLSTGPIPAAAGVSLYFAYAFGKPFDYASHPMRIDLVP